MTLHELLALLTILITHNCYLNVLFFQGGKSKKSTEEDLLNAIKETLEKDDPDETFGRNVAHWLRCIPQDIKEDVKFSIHLLCYKAMKEGVVPSLSYI